MLTRSSGIRRSALLYTLITVCPVVLSRITSGLLRSRTEITICAFAAACRLRSMPIFSNWSEVSRRPAVSMRRKRMPSRMSVSSIVSRVVPWMSLTMARCSPKSALRSVDLPTFGAPTMATGIPFRMAFPVRKDAISAASLVSISAAKALSSVRSANSSSSWSAKSSSSSMSEVKCSSRSRKAANSLDTEPRN